MAYTEITNGMAAASVRSNINAMFTELYTYGFMSEKQSFSDGSPGTGDPASLTTNTHTLTGSYTSTPIAILIPKSDWHVYISSVNTTTVVVGVGAYGSGSSLDYDIIIISTDI